MELTNIRNPAWADASHTTVLVRFDHPLYGAINFTCLEADDTAHGTEIFARALAGEFGPIAEYVAPPPEPTQVPQTVSRYQGMAALQNAGLLAPVVTYMGTSATPTEKLAWDNIQEFTRTSPLLAKLALLLGLSEAAIDALFMEAATIVA